MDMFACFSSTLTLWASNVRMLSFQEQAQERPWAGSHTVFVSLVPQ